MRKVRWNSAFGNIASDVAVIPGTARAPEDPEVVDFVLPREDFLAGGVPYYMCSP